MGNETWAVRRSDGSLLWLRTASEQHTRVISQCCSLIPCISVLERSFRSFSSLSPAERLSTPWSRTTARRKRYATRIPPSLALGRREKVYLFEAVMLRRAGISDGEILVNEAGRVRRPPGVNALLWGTICCPPTKCCTDGRNCQPFREIVT